MQSEEKTVSIHLSKEETDQLKQIAEAYHQTIETFATSVIQAVINQELLLFAPCIQSENVQFA